MYNFILANVESVGQEIKNVRSDELIDELKSGNDVKLLDLFQLPSCSNLNAVHSQCTKNIFLSKNILETFSNTCTDFKAHGGQFFSMLL